MATMERVHGTGTATHAVIWLHGLGASADDFYPVVPHLGLASSRCTRFVFPQAPDRPITVNGGYMMPGWYDIKGADIADKQDLAGMRQSQSTLEALISAQVAQGVPSKNIVLAGFSQGGAVAYYTGLRSQHKVAGILALSTYLPFADTLEQEHSGVNLPTPVMAMHGVQDGVVPLALGKQSAEQASALGYCVDWQEYMMEHSVIPEQLTDIGTWLNRVLGQ